MESLDQLQKQLDSLEELRTIVKTMKALSAASIRQYERAVEALTMYYRTVERGLQAVLSLMQLPANAAGMPGREAGKVGAIVFGSDHGLCGRFNESIVEYALALIASREADPGRRVVLAVGARAAATLEYEGQAVEETLLIPGAAAQITTTVQRILLTIDAWRAAREVQSLYVIHNWSARRGTYEPKASLLLPIDLGRFRELQQESWPSRGRPTASMSPDRLLSRLTKQYLFVSLFRACAESQASEHAARLTAMQSAERSLDTRLEDVTAEFRRARQDAITSELLDVVSGFEAITTRE